MCSGAFRGETCLPTSKVVVRKNATTVRRGSELCRVFVMDERDGSLGDDSCRIYVVEGYQSLDVGVVVGWGSLLVGWSCTRRKRAA